MKAVGVLLAAGRSVRFGEGNKLLQDFCGQPLCRYAAKAMSAAGLSDRIAVVRDDAVAAELGGFKILRCLGNQSDSLKMGVRAAMALNADQIVVCLADMPFVTPALIGDLMGLARSHSICGCESNGAMGPPVIFRRDQFSRLLTLEGDKGAGAFLKTLPESALLKLNDLAAVDLDTPEDFVACATYLRGTLP